MNAHALPCTAAMASRIHSATGTARSRRRTAGRGRRGATDVTGRGVYGASSGRRATLLRWIGRNHRAPSPFCAGRAAAPMNRHLAIVPAYNEAGAIAGAVADIRRHAPDFDVVVVDDGSTDLTAERAKAAGAKVIQPPFNLG